MSDESPEIRLKRLHMRSWRRGMKEMDLILGSFAEGPMKTLTPSQLDDYEALLSENDQLLYLWVTARVHDRVAPDERDDLAAILEVIATHTRANLEIAARR